MNNEEKPLYSIGYDNVVEKIFVSLSSKVKQDIMKALEIPKKYQRKMNIY